MRRWKRRTACLVIVLYMLLAAAFVSLPFIWLAQGWLTWENFDSIYASVLLLLMGYTVLAALVALVIRFGRFTDDETEN